VNLIAVIKPLICTFISLKKRLWFAYCICFL